jgi:uncharacterized membrane protein SpoIIM required for sporulation
MRSPQDIQPKSQRFRAEREWDWRRLEGLLQRAERRSAASLTDDELLAIPVLYRSTLSSLSVARATSLDHSLIEYLESLSTRAYFFVYGARASLRERLTGFFVETWPAAVKSMWRETLISLFIFVAASLVGYLMVTQDASWFAAFMPGEEAQGRDPTATTAFLKSTLYPNLEKGHPALSTFATALFAHNSQVSIFSFALGFALGVPTAFLIAQNALSLGAMFSVFASHGLGFQLGGWLSIHGSTEIFALILSGAAGFKIGWAVAFPGGRPRLEAAAAAGRSAGSVMAGVVVMLMIAGGLEGFGRQLIQNDYARYAIGGAMLTLWLCYFYLPRPKRRPV